MSHTAAYKPLFAYEQSPMSQDVAKMFLTLTLDEQSNEDDNSFSDMIISDLSEETPFKMFTNHITAFDLDDAISPRVKVMVFLTMLNTASFVPAHIELYTRTLKQMAEKYGFVTMMILTKKFSLGFPDHEQLSLAWDDLKAYKYSAE